MIRDDEAEIQRLRRKAANLSNQLDNVLAREFILRVVVVVLLCLCVFIAVVT